MYRFARNPSSVGVHLDSMEEIVGVNIRNDDRESFKSNGFPNSEPQLSSMEGKRKGQWLGLRESDVTQDENDIAFRPRRFFLLG